VVSLPAMSAQMVRDGFFIGEQSPLKNRTIHASRGDLLRIRQSSLPGVQTYCGLYLKNDWDIITDPGRRVTCGRCNRILDKYAQAARNCQAALSERAKDRTGEHNGSNTARD
jgi:hypothetical protein